MSDRRADQRYGRFTETRPGVEAKQGVAKRFRVKTWGKMCDFNYQYKPGEIWLVHASRNGGPITEHYTLIGETPEEWEKKHKHCSLCPRMRTKMRFATVGLTSQEEMEENFLHLRNNLLFEKDWTVNLKFDFVVGYFNLIQPIAFEPWKGINDRTAMPPIAERPIRTGGMVVDQHSFRKEDHD